MDKETEKETQEVLKERLKVMKWKYFLIGIFVGMAFTDLTLWFLGRGGCLAYK